MLKFKLKFKLYSLFISFACLLFCVLCCLDSEFCINYLSETKKSSFWSFQFTHKFGWYMRKCLTHLQQVWKHLKTTYIKICLNIKERLQQNLKSTEQQPVSVDFKIYKQINVFCITAITVFNFWNFNNWSQVRPTCIPLPSQFCQRICEGPFHNRFA